MNPPAKVWSVTYNVSQPLLLHPPLQLNLSRGLKTNTIWHFHQAQYWHLTNWDKMIVHPHLTIYSPVILLWIALTNCMNTDACFCFILKGKSKQFSSPGGRHELLSKRENKDRLCPRTTISVDIVHTGFLSPNTWDTLYQGFSLYTLGAYKHSSMSSKGLLLPLPVSSSSSSSSSFSWLWMMSNSSDVSAVSGFWVVDRSTLCASSWLGGGGTTWCAQRRGASQFKLRIRSWGRN